MQEFFRTVNFENIYGKIIRKKDKLGFENFPRICNGKE
jgi:hypothetical protein